MELGYFVVSIEIGQILWVLLQVELWKVAEYRLTVDEGLLHQHAWAPYQDDKEHQQHLLG
mgnify:CR=1 FL=1